jgi:hypothetical protein
VSLEGFDVFSGMLGSVERTLFIPNAMFSALRTRSSDRGSGGGKPARGRSCILLPETRIRRAREVGFLNVSDGVGLQKILARLRLLAQTKLLQGIDMEMSFP